MKPFILFAVFFAAVFLSSPFVQAEELKCSIGVSAMVNIFSKIAAPFEKETNIKIVYTASDTKGVGSDVVFKEIDSGSAECGAAGTTWESWLSMMKEKGYTPKNLGDIKNRIIGRDRIQIMVNKKLDVKALTEAQIISLLTGKISNWKEVGGKDVPTKLVLTKAQPATEKFISDKLLGGMKIKETGSLRTDTPDEMVKQIGTLDGAYGFGPVNLVNDSIVVPKHPTIGRPIIFVWRGAPSPKIQKLMDFILNKGKNFGIVQ